MLKNTKHSVLFIKIAPYILLAIFSCLTAFSLFMNCDDYIWFFVDSNDKLADFRHPNGRYISNIITIILVKYPFIRHLFISCVLFIMIIILSKLIGDYNLMELKLCFMLSSLILIPSNVYREVITWISGFTNYFFSVLLVLIYLYCIFDVLFFKKQFKLYHYFLFPILALISGLCVEHIALYDVVLGLAIIILFKVRLNKFFVPPLLFFSFSIFALCLMFSNDIYFNIFDSGDTLATRQFLFSFSDLFNNFVFFIVPAFSKTLWVVNLLISFSFFIIYRNSGDRIKSGKYSLVCLIIILLYCSYSVISITFANFNILDPAMRIRGFEAAFTFLYLVALAYLIFILFNNNTRVKLYIFLLSAVFLTAPFVVISPASPRCFFSEYVFWILFCGEIFFSSLKYVNPNNIRLYIISALSITAYIVLFILNIELSNKYYYNLRISFFKDQITDINNDDVMIIELPYEDYAYDDFPKDYFYNAELCDGITYFTLIYDYYSIDAYELKYSDFSFISPFDYNLLMNE